MSRNHLLRLRDPLAAYGEVSDEIDWDHPALLAQRLRWAVLRRRAGHLLGESRPL